MPSANLKDGWRGAMCYLIVSAVAEKVGYSTSFHEKGCGALFSAFGSFFGAAMTSGGLSGVLRQI